MIKIVHVLFFATILQSIALKSIAQFEFPKLEDAVAFKKRTLIVELKEEDPSQIKKLAKDSEGLKAYKDRITNYNKMVKDFVTTDYWKLNDKIEYKTTTEIDGLIKSGSTDYSILHSSWFSKAQRTNANMITKYSVYSFVGYLIEDAKKRNENEYIKGEVFSVSMPASKIKPGDLIFVLNVFNNYISAAANGATKKEMFDIEKNLETIKTKTLLLDEKSLQSSKEDILKAYTYPLEIVDREVIEKAILEKNGNYFFPVLIWSDAHNYYLFVAANTADGALLAKMGTGGFNITAGSANQSTNTYTSLISYNSYLLISDKVVGTIASSKAQKVNNFLK